MPVSAGGTISKIKVRAWVGYEAGATGSAIVGLLIMKGDNEWQALKDCGTLTGGEKKYVSAEWTEHPILHVPWTNAHLNDLFEIGAQLTSGQSGKKVSLYQIFVEIYCSEIKEAVKNLVDHKGWYLLVTQRRIYLYNFSKVWEEIWLDVENEMLKGINRGNYLLMCQ